MKRVLSIILASAIVLTGCAEKHFDWVVEIDGNKISSDMYRASMLTAVIDNEIKYVGQEKEHSIKDIIPGIQNNEALMQKTNQILKRYQFIENEYSSLNIDLTTQELEYIKNDAQNKWDIINSVYENNSIPFECYLDLMTNKYKEDRVLLNKYTTGENALSDEQIDELIRENIADVQGFYIYKNCKGEAFTTEKARELKQLVENTVIILNNGEDFTKTALECFDKAQQLTNIEYSQQEYFFRTLLFKDTYQYAEYQKEIFNLGYKDIGLFENDNYYLIVIRDSDYQSQGIYDRIKLLAIRDEKSKEFNDYVNSNLDNLEVIVNEEAQNYYLAKGINIEF